MAEPIAVVIPVRDAERYLGAAIESVLAQAVPVQLVVVDDGSRDRSLAIARSYPSAHVLALPPSGIAAARNAGVAATVAKWIAFLDADDLWLPTKLERQLARHAANPALGYSLTRLANFLEPGCSMPPWFTIESQARDRLGFLTTGLFRRELFETVGPFDPSYVIGEDVDWLVRAREAGVPFSILDEVLVQRRVHSTNISADVRTGRAGLLKSLRHSLERRKIFAP